MDLILEYIYPSAIILFFFNLPGTLKLVVMLINYIILTFFSRLVKLDMKILLNGVI